MQYGGKLEVRWHNTNTIQASLICAEDVYNHITKTFLLSGITALTFEQKVVMDRAVI